MESGAMTRLDVTDNEDVYTVWVEEACYLEILQVVLRHAHRRRRQGMPMARLPDTQVSEGILSQLRPG